MSIFLFATVVSFITNFFLMIPFINFLYKLKLQRRHQETRDAFNKPTPIFDKYNQHKTGTPIGGGILITSTTILLFSFFIFLFIIFNRSISSNYPSIFAEVKIILFTFLGFALLGVYDDLNKIFFWKKKPFFGLRLRHKLILQIILASIAAWWLYSDLKIDIIHIPFIGLIKTPFIYIPFATFVITAFANAVNITDGLDGLASGVMMIALAGFWAISRTFLDVPSSIFIAVWLGGLIAFLYFNIYPARIMLGDAGALSFGAAYAVIGLILGKSFALPIIGGVFVIEIASSFIQLIGKKYFKKKIFPVSPFHLWLQLKGWEEPKIVMRLWLISIIFTIFGLMLAFMK